jgi:Thiol-disulfide isomerase and thioredoxins
MLAFDKHTHIKGRVSGLGNDTVWVEYMTFSERLNQAEEIHKDTVVAVNDCFSYRIPEPEPVLFIMEPNQLVKHRENGHKYQSDTRMFFLMIRPDEELEITGRIEEEGYLYYEVSGSDFNKEMARHRNTKKDLLCKEDSVEMQIDYYAFSKKAPENSEIKVRELQEERVKLSRQQQEMNRNYIRNHLDTELAAFYLTGQPLDTFAVYISRLKGPAQNGRFKELLTQRTDDYNAYKQRLINKDKIIPGAPAPDFKLTSDRGKEIQLSSLSKEIVVLDFWGSWCGWCIHGFPKMKEYYQKYGDRLEIVGIACKDSENAWLQAIENHELNWVNVLSEKENDMSVTYAIEVFPTKILLDKEKRIIGVYKGETNEFYEKIDEMLK